MKKTTIALLLILTLLIIVAYAQSDEIKYHCTLIQNQTGSYCIETVNDTQKNNATSGIVNNYIQDIADLETIQNRANMTNEQVIWAVKKNAEILERTLKHIKSQTLSGGI